jgi:SAM-dependent methyltransferase
MNTKHDILTEAELRNYKLRSSVLRLIDACAAEQGVSPKALRILDWGCGRGRTVAKLLEMGIDAYGVDIDPEPINNGYDLLFCRGEQPLKRLICIDRSCRTPFQDGYFNLIISDQVIEHVSDLNGLITELSRITADDGAGLHNFPARWCLIEPHLLIPFLHWLPKNRLRLWYLRFLLFRIPTWKDLENKTSQERARIYFEYSIQKTYYRPLARIHQSFSQRGFRIDIGSKGRPNLFFKLCFPFLFFNNGVSTKFWLWYSINFKDVEITTRRIRDNDQIQAIARAAA